MNKRKFSLQLLFAGGLIAKKWADLLKSGFIDDTEGAGYSFRAESAFLAAIFYYPDESYFLYPSLPNASPFPVWQSWRRLSIYLPQLKLQAA